MYYLLDKSKKVWYTIYRKIKGDLQMQASRNFLLEKRNQKGQGIFCEESQRNKIYCDFFMACTLPFYNKKGRIS